MQSDLNWNKVKEDKLVYDKIQEEKTLIKFFTPPEGDFEVVWLNEGTIGSEVPDKFKAGKMVKKVLFAIIYLGNEWKWEMNYSLSPKAPFYEIYEYSNRVGGSIKGKKTRFRCKGKGIDRVLTILD